MMQTSIVTKMATAATADVTAIIDVNADLSKNSLDCTATSDRSVGAF